MIKNVKFSKSKTLPPQKKKIHYMLKHHKQMMSNSISVDVSKLSNKQRKLRIPESVHTKNCTKHIENIFNMNWEGFYHSEFLSQFQTTTKTAITNILRKDAVPFFHLEFLNLCQNNDNNKNKSFTHKCIFHTMRPWSVLPQVKIFHKYDFSNKNMKRQISMSKDKALVPFWLSISACF